MTLNVHLFGTSGLIGSRLSTYLYGLDNYSIHKYSIWNENNSKKFDLLSYSSKCLDEVNPGDIAIILMAKSKPDYCENNFVDAFKVNVDATIRFISLLLERQAKIIFCSTDGVYGGCKGIVDETTKANPFGAYATMKYLVERYFEKSEEFKVVRLSYVFSKDDIFYTHVCGEKKRSESPVIYSGFSRNVVCINDVLIGFRMLIDGFERIKFKVVNFCGPQNLDRSDMYRILMQYDKNLLCPIMEIPSTKFYEARVSYISCRSLFFEKLIEQPATSYANYYGWCYEN